MTDNIFYKLSPNKTFTFHFKNEQGGRQFVRTGTYSDGNCFFHSLLRCISSDYRKAKDYKIHHELVKQFKQALVNWLTVDIFKQLGNGEFSKLLFIQKFIQKIQSSKEDSKDSNTRITIKHILTPNVIETIILPKTQTSTQNFYSAFIENATEYLISKLNSILNLEHIKWIATDIPKYFIPIFKESFDECFQDFKNKLLKDGEFVDSTQMETISLYVGYNFIFLDGNTMEGYAGGNDVVHFNDKQPTLIFIWIHENHFEIFGELIEPSIINRIFSSKDPIIYSILKSP